MKDRTSTLNMDCLDYMKSLPDNAFDLIIADPPYGDCDGSWGGVSQGSRTIQDDMPDTLGGGGLADGSADTDGQAVRGKVRQIQNGGGCFRLHGGGYAEKYNKRDDGIFWDVAPSQEVFEEMFRVSKNQIIWGGNYFDLPPTRCFVVWEKLSISESFSMAMCEYAWTSFKGMNAKLWKGTPQGTAQFPRFHPTQKPIGLYRFLLHHFAKEGDRILDPFLGSGSSRIAAYEMGFEFVGIEKDEDYFKQQEARFQDWTSQGTLDFDALE